METSPRHHPTCAAARPGSSRLKNHTDACIRLHRWTILVYVLEVMGSTCIERCKWMRPDHASIISYGHRSDDDGGTELDSCNRVANGSRTVAGARLFHPFVRLGWDWWWSILQSDGGSFPGHEIQIFSIDPSTPLEARLNPNPNHRKERRRTSIRSKPGEHHLIGSNGANRTTRAEDRRCLPVGSPLRYMQGGGHSSATRCWPR